MRTLALIAIFALAFTASAVTDEEVYTSINKVDYFSERCDAAEYHHHTRTGRGEGGEENVIAFDSV
jgi:hypothetical protein